MSSYNFTENLPQLHELWVLSKSLNAISTMQVNGAIKRTPFEATFGQRGHLGLRDSVIPRSIASTLRTQEELEVGS